MPRVIAIANQKGGSGKTTTTRSLASALGARGRRVLMIDLDPQASLSAGCIPDHENLRHTIYQVLLNQAQLPDIVCDVEDNVWIAPANIHLSGAELQLVNANRREDRLRNALKPYRAQFDFALIDCPPSFGLLCINALSAADSVLIPMSCDYYTTLGVKLLLDTIADIQREVNASLTIEGLLPTRFDSRTHHAKEMLERARTELEPMGIRVFETVVRESVRFKESPMANQSIHTYAGSSPGAKAYRALAEEIDRAETS